MKYGIILYNSNCGTMHISSEGRASSTVLGPSFITYKESPVSNSFIGRNREDIYLNIEMPPTFTPSHQKTLQHFNRKLQQNLKEREMQQLLQTHNNRLAKGMRRPRVSLKTKVGQDDKIGTVDDKCKRQSKSLVSLVKCKASPKKYSFDGKYEASAKGSIFTIPSIREDPLEENLIFQNLIASQSSKGLIQRLLKRKKQVTQQQEETTKCIFRYPLNRKHYTKTAKKIHSIKGQRLIIKFDQPSTDFKSPLSPCKLPFKHITHYRNKDLILSPSKPKQPPYNPQKLPSFCARNTLIKGQKYEGEEIGPWMLQGNVSFDI